LREAPVVIQFLTEGAESAGRRWEDLLDELDAIV
jgi:hypothetical protein